MSPNGRSRFEDAKRVAILVSLTLGFGAIAGGAYKCIAWAVGLQTVVDAKTQHKALRTHIRTRESKVHAKEQHDEIRKDFVDHLKAQTDTNHQILDELKTVRQRTWELVQKKRNGSP